MKTEFLVGKALRPRGLKGEIRFELYTGDPSRFRSLQHLRLGDTAFDVIGAAAHGISTLGVSWGYGKVSEMEQAGAIAIANTTKELFDLICK